MNRYFGNFPTISYNNKSMINIMDRTVILNSVFGDVYSFYPYHVKNGMRADTVAEKYYGDPDLVWLVYFSNNIVDPYHDWPMDDDTFNKFLVDKYGSYEQAIQTIVDYRVNWFEDTRSLSPSQYNSLNSYEKKYWTPNFDFNGNAQSWVRKQLDISAVNTLPAPINTLAPSISGLQGLSQILQVDSGKWADITLSVPTEEQSYWTSVTAIQYEQEQNAAKANIRLLDKKLVPVAVANIETLLAS